MPEPMSYPPGALCWADLLAPEPAAAQRFYADVLGWRYVHAGAAFDDYAYATHARHMVAGIANGEEGTGAWVVIFATDRADALAERIVAAGGEVKDGPRDFGIQGRSLFAADAAGAHVGFWQPLAHQGAGLVGAPGALCWAELAVRDVPAADIFYRSVLGLRTAAHAAAGSPDYAAYLLDAATTTTAATTAAWPWPAGPCWRGPTSSRSGCPISGSPTPQGPPPSRRTAAARSGTRARTPPGAGSRCSPTRGAPRSRCWNCQADA